MRGWVGLAGRMRGGADVAVRMTRVRSRADIAIRVWGRAEDAT